LSNQTATGGETWRARAQERKGCFQALPAGISTYGEYGVVAGKAENIDRDRKGSPLGRTLAT
jgi:hypothetical protein